MSFAKGKLIISLISKEPPEDKSGWTINSQKEGDVLSTWGLTNICLELILWTFKSFHTCSEKPKRSKCGSGGWRAAAPSPSTAVWVLLVLVPTRGWLWWFINDRGNKVPFVKVILFGFFLLGKFAFKSFVVKRLVLRQVRAIPTGHGKGWWLCPGHGATGIGHGGHEQRSCFCVSLLLDEKPQEKSCAVVQSYRLDPVTSRHDSSISRAPPLRPLASVLFKGSSFKASSLGLPTRFVMFYGRVCLLFVCVPPRMAPWSRLSSRGCVPGRGPCLAPLSARRRSSHGQTGLMGGWCLSQSWGAQIIFQASFLAVPPKPTFAQL